MDKNLGIMKSIIIIILSIFICLFILYIPEKTGLSDNGDFGRITEPCALTSTNKANDYFFYQSEYTMDISGTSFLECLGEIWQKNIYQNIDYSSTQFFFVNMAKTYNYIFNTIFNIEKTHFSMLFLNLQYIIIFAFAFWLMYKSFRTNSFKKNICILAILSLIFFDLGYIIYFNSMYGEALQYCSFMLITSILLYTVQCFRQGERLTSLNYMLLIVFFIFTFVFGTAKTANIPIGIIFSLCGILITLLTTRGFSKLLLTILGCASIILTLVQLTQIPAWMTHSTNYNAVFYGIVKGSSTPQNDLKELGIDTRYATLGNTNSYNSQDKYNVYSQDYSDEIYNQLSKSNIVKFYFSHPNRALEKINISLESARIIKPTYLGNYEAENHNKLDTNNNFQLWSNFRNAINITSPLVFIVLAILSLCYIIINFIRYITKLTRDKLPNDILLYDTPILNTIIYLTLLASLICSLLIPFLTNGEADLQKHMFLFNNILDIMLVIVICSFILNIDKTVTYIKDKFANIFASH